MVASLPKCGHPYCAPPLIQSCTRTRTCQLSKSCNPIFIRSYCHACMYKSTCMHDTSMHVCISEFVFPQTRSGHESESSPNKLWKSLHKPPLTSLTKLLTQNRETRRRLRRRRSLHAGLQSSQHLPCHETQLTAYQLLQRRRVHAQHPGRRGA